MKVRELYRDALIYEESLLAHFLYHLLQENKISLESDVKDIIFQQADYKKVEDLIAKNVLGIRKIRIFSLKMNRNKFVFIFAESEEIAIAHYQQVFHKKPINCHEYPLDFEMIRGNEVTSFREMRKEYERFPAIAFYYTKL